MQYIDKDSEKMWNSASYMTEKLNGKGFDKIKTREKYRTSERFIKTWNKFYNKVN